MTHQKVIISRSHEARVSRLQTVTLAAHGLSISIRVPPEQMQFPQSPQNIPVSRTMFASGSQTRRPPPRHWLGAASGQILQIFPAWARLWARTRRPGLCLAAWSAGPGTGDLPRSLESGSLYTVHWRTVHCTGHSCTVHRVTPYLHLQFIKSNCREDFYSHSTYCQLRLMEKYFPP